MKTITQGTRLLTGITSNCLPPTWEADFGGRLWRQVVLSLFWFVGIKIIQGDPPKEDPL